MKLVLKSNITKKTWEFNVTDRCDSRMFYHFPNFQLTEQRDDGEYDYELYDNEELVAQGLLQIGDYENNVRTYTTTQNGYRQYNPET